MDAVGRVAEARLAEAKRYHREPWMLDTEPPDLASPLLSSGHAVSISLSPSQKEDVDFVLLHIGNT